MLGHEIGWQEPCPAHHSNRSWVLTCRKPDDVERLTRKDDSGQATG
jgi:hypothetical protein